MLSSILNKIVIILFAFFFISLVKAQERTVDSLLLSVKKDSLQNIYGKGKQMPQSLILPVYVALSYFPELKETNIHFKKAKIATTLNVRPTISSVLFRKKTKRNYIVRINNSSKDSIIRFDNVPFNASIGLLAHEFCHIVDYNRSSLSGIINRMLSYASEKSKARYEKEIDLMVISRGLRWQLYDWASFIMYTSNATQKYKRFKQRVYLKPEEIHE
jgi:hypothetical protein